MPIKSEDLIKQELMTNLAAAMQSENQDAIAEAFMRFANSVQQNVLEDMRKFQQTSDESILQARGVRVLTQKEKDFYQKYITAIKADPKQAFTGSENALPETVLEDVLGKIATNHPLLQVINFRPTSARIKIIMNAQASQKAVWGALGTAITKELNANITNKSLSLSKLTAYLPISVDMLDVGAEWLDAYIREILTESLALGLEDAIVTGTGKDMPIGMDRQVQDDVSISAGVYPQKTKVAVTSFSPTAYGALIAKIAEDPVDSTKARPVPSVVLIVNPFDYFTKIMPATTILKNDGTYATNVFPYPTTVIQSCAVTKNSAIIGLPSLYFAAVGPGSTGGKLEFSDEFKFLDDVRTHKIKMYGSGRAEDNNAFQLLDITNLVPVDREVVVKEVKGVVNTKAQA